MSVQHSSDKRPAIYVLASEEERIFLLNEVNRLKVAGRQASQSGVMRRALRMYRAALERGELPDEDIGE